MFTSKVWTDDSRLLQESNLAARQPQGTISVIQAIAGEGLAQGPYMAARGGVEPTTFRTEDLHLTNHVPSLGTCDVTSPEYAPPLLPLVLVLPVPQSLQRRLLGRHALRSAPEAAPCSHPMYHPKHTSLSQPQENSKINRNIPKE